MQLEEACVVAVAKLMEYVNSKEGPKTQTVTAHRNNKNFTMLQADTSPKRESVRVIRQIKYIITEKTRNMERKKRMNNFHVT
jgi:hypothetical protein